nr:DUF29 family protein [uncultured Rhodopila sp.]
MSQYDADVALWADRQTGLLRRRAAGELVNDSELDWPHIAEEIESVGNAGCATRRRGDAGAVWRAADRADRRPGAH